MTAAVTRGYRFSASHRLHTEALSEAENATLFGKCNNPYGHGHNYRLEVTVGGVIDPDIGIVISVVALDRYVFRSVLREFDGKNFNLDIQEFQSLVPTTENLTQVIADRLTAQWEEEFGPAAPRLVRVHVQETERNSFELLLAFPGQAAALHEEAVASLEYGGRK
jgi:6-pyruvoyltetrahydropterin/6-carboxytetrahydropterin synthase